MVTVGICPACGYPSIDVCFYCRRDYAAMGLPTPTHPDLCAGQAIPVSNYRPSAATMVATPANPNPHQQPPAHVAA
jgi:hypothetical protein